MSSDPETTPPAKAHYLLTSDLLEVYPPNGSDTLKTGRTFRVLSEVLSGLDIRTGDVIEMKCAPPGSMPEPYAIVAVSLIWHDIVLLRQFIPPRLLITNSTTCNLPHMHLGRSVKIVGQLRRIG